MTRRTSTFGVAAALCALLVSHPHGQQQPQQPTFRTGVEVTTLDVSVVDDNGRPIADLKPNEFRVRVDGKDRRVVSAEWIPLSSSAPNAAAAVSAPPPPAGHSSNASPTRGRLILIAIDQPNIRAGGAMLFRNASLNAFIDRLEPSDRAAAVALGQGGVSTPFTSDREAVKRAIGTMAGSMRLPSEVAPRIQLAVSEAFDIVQDNTAVLDRVYSRECLRAPIGQVLRVPTPPPPCVEDIRSSARAVQASALIESDETVRSLRALLDGLRRIDAPKTLVVVTEGFAVTDQGGVAELGSLAAASKTTLFVLRLMENGADASARDSLGPQAINGDRQLREMGAAFLASATKGEMFNVIGTGRPVVERLEREVSGYYLLGVESAPADSDGDAHPISVQVSRPRTTVRAHREYVEVANRRAPDAGDPITEAFRSPLLMNGLTLLATASVVRDDDPSKVRLLLSAEVGSGYTAAQDVKLGYLISDSKDVEVVNRAAQGRLPVKAGDKAPLTFTAEESLPPGDYVWKLAVAEGARVGSVEHAIHTGPLNAVPARPATTTNATPIARPVAVAVAPRPFRREDATSAEMLKKFEAGVAAEGRTAFAQGVAALSAGNYAAAEEGFRAALQSSFAGGKTVTPMTYLGATFAASGRDAEAVGIWQVALTDGSTFAEIYDWLAEALIRIKDLAQARNILKEATEKWPAETRFSSRLADLSAPAGAR